MKHTIAFAAATLACGGAASANILTFDGASACDGPCFSGTYILQTYGDVPGLDISYRSMTDPGNSTVSDANGLRFWNDAYGDLIDVAWGGINDGAGAAEITFTLTAGHSLTLNQALFAGWPAQTRATELRIYDLNYNLLTADAFDAPGVGHTVRTIGLTTTTGFILQWGPSAFNVGIDNIDFTLDAAAVPEPATWSLMIGGFGLAGSALRRRRSLIAA